VFVRADRAQRRAVCVADLLRQFFLISLADLLEQCADQWGVRCAVASGVDAAAARSLSAESERRLRRRA
jgi:hypothetical protein